MTPRVEHIAARSFHGRRGEVRNAFTYSLDCVLLDPEHEGVSPALFSRNARNLSTVLDRDHGGQPGQGRGALSLRAMLADHGLERATTGRLLLLTQPRLLGHVFNPVSFWLCHDDADRLRVAVAEVTNTYGDRHWYLCHHDDLAPIRGDAVLNARKMMHVSPFQPMRGDYRFRFDIRPGAVDIVIDYRHDDGGVVATLQGTRRPLTNGAILKAMLRRPLGTRRVLALIHWQALKLWGKGAPFRSRPQPQDGTVSR